MAERRTLDRLLSRAGLCSRAEAARWIADGRVRVGGRTVRSGETWVDPARDDVTLDGRPLRGARPLYLVLNKPKGYLTSRGDPRGRRTVYALLADLPAWVFPSDAWIATRGGLLLLTTTPSSASACRIRIPGSRRSTA
jgi:16S rRNA U516 pseudouridylate synthase RsuA-like enzyme